MACPPKGQTPLCTEPRLTIDPVSNASRTFMPSDSFSSHTTCVEVALGERSYPIEITSSELDEIGARILLRIPDLTHALVIFDSEVEKRWGSLFIKSFSEPSLPNGNRIRVDSIAVASGESSKSISQLAELWQWMLDRSADRKSVVIAIGGGVVGDLAGFAAATYTRGIRFVQIPTTLLAMVDSSVGGKTGINLPTSKNMIGAFWQPSLVLIDTDMLRTLPKRAYLSGLAEVIKYGVIDDISFFEWLEENSRKLVDCDDKTVRRAIAESCRSKANVVSEDERETSGRRAILNYGHTFAHALEATAGYGTLLHGEAVAIGMQMAANLAVATKLCSTELLNRQTTLIESCELPTTFPDADVKSMLVVMQQDKKVSHGKLRFVLPERIGQVKMVGDVDQAYVARAIEACR